MNACSFCFASRSHLQYPIRFAPLSISATTTTSNHLKLNENTAPNANNTHIAGATYRAVQKIRESFGCTCRFEGLLSKIHTLVPSSLTSFHHLKPTNILPDTFFCKYTKSTTSPMQCKL